MMFQIQVSLYTQGSVDYAVVIVLCGNLFCLKLNFLQYYADATVFPPIYLYSYSPHPLYIGMLFPTVCCCCFYAYFT